MRSPLDISTLALGGIAAVRTVVAPLKGVFVIPSIVVAIVLAGLLQG